VPRSRKLLLRDVILTTALLELQQGLTIDISSDAELSLSLTLLLVILLFVDLSQSILDSLVGYLITGLNRRFNTLLLGLLTLLFFFFFTHFDNVF
jgi:hypothetical protein